MKKAFDQNVSRSRPRLRLGTLTQIVEDAAQEEAPVAAAPAPAPTAKAEPSLQETVKARAERARAPKASMAEAMHKALVNAPVPTAKASPPPPPAHVEEDDAKVAVAAVYSELEQTRTAAPSAAAVQALVAAPPPAPAAAVQALVSRFEPPQEEVEVQTPEPELPAHEVERDLGGDPETRRERLKERLRAIRENPRPAPLPPTVAEAGVLAVERIAALQIELNKVKALNLALTQDLEGARRQAEKATEEARLRMDESRRLSEAMEGRVRLLEELERELAALEGERDEALLALQETRQALDADEKEKATLREEIEKRDQALAESLSEEERLCSELETARDDAGMLRRSVEALTVERDTLARQVAELTTERAELLEARKALEAVHRALSSAAGR